MGTPLKNPPVYFTLAQVLFNPILVLADFLPKIQERFRLIGYPDFERHSSVAIQLTVQADQAPIPMQVKQERFLLGNVEKTHVFVLDGQNLTLQSTDYGHFEDFSKRFLDGLKIVHDAVQLAFTERVGLRYLDFVMPEPEESIEQYLIEQVHGLPPPREGKVLYSYAEAMSEIGSVKLLSRVAIQNGPLAFPPDLHPGNMVVAERFAKHLGKSAILDNDGFAEGREVFSIKSVSDHLNAIHRVTGDAFRIAAKPYALTAWDK